MQTAKSLNLRRRGVKIYGHNGQIRRANNPKISSSSTSRMRTYLVLTSLLACYFSYATATALTYKLVANEKACFFSNVEQQGAKIAFYFAVSRSIPAHEETAMCPYLWS